MPCGDEASGAIPIGLCQTLRMWAGAPLVAAMIVWEAAVRARAAVSASWAIRFGRHGL